MTNNREYVGKDVNGNGLFVGDVVEVVEHHMVRADRVGDLRTIASAKLLHPTPPGLEAILGDGFFDATDDEGEHYALHCACVKKVDKH